MPGVRSVSFGAWVRAASLHETRDAHGRLAPPRAHGVQGDRDSAARTRSRCRSRRSAARSTRTRRASTPCIRRACSTSICAKRPTSLATSCFARRFATADLTLERKVILEEIGMVEDTPDDLVFELHNEALWGAHPYGYSILGTRETVNALGVPDLRELHARAYHPGQLVVVAVGQRRARAAARRARRRRAGSTSRRGDATPLDARRRRRSERRPSRHVAREGAQTHIVAGTDRGRARRSAPLSAAAC